MRPSQLSMNKTVTSRVTMKSGIRRKGATDWTMAAEQQQTLPDGQRPGLVIKPPPSLTPGGGISVQHYLLRIWRA